MTDRKRWRGLKDLVRDATLHGTQAVERVHLQTAHRPMHLLRRIAPIAAPVEGVEKIHDAVVTSTYEVVRTVTRAVDLAADVAFDALDALDGAKAAETTDAHKAEPDKAQPDEAEPDEARGDGDVAPNSR